MHIENSLVDPGLNWPEQGSHWGLNPALAAGALTTELQFPTATRTLTPALTVIDNPISYIMIDSAKSYPRTQDSQRKSLYFSGHF